MKRPNLEKFEQLERERLSECKHFHDALLAIGVHAYRVNDGWVNDVDNIASFFDNDKQIGYYWKSDELKSGSLIYIGSHDCDGFLCYVDEVIESPFSLKCKFLVLSKVSKSLWAIKSNEE